MAGKIVADTLEHSTAGSVTTDYVVNGSAKAWARANQATISESQSFNVSSSTDHGTGDHSHTLTNALDTRGQLVATTRRTAGGIGVSMNENRDSASVMAMLCYNSSGTATDSRNICVYFGDLA